MTQDLLLKSDPNIGTKKQYAWIKANFDQLAPEKQARIKDHERNIRYSSIGGFLVGMIPHIKMLSNQSINISRFTGLKGLAKLILFIQIPFISSALFSHWFQMQLKSFISELESSQLERNPLMTKSPKP